jgi:hypothetical protein
LQRSLEKQACFDFCILKQALRRTYSVRLRAS